MRRDAYKFLSGSAAALAYAHAAYALAASKGIMNEPVLFGRKWGLEFAWGEVVIYSAISLALAYRGWLAGGTPVPPARKPVTVDAAERGLPFPEADGRKDAGSLGRQHTERKR